MALPPRAPVDWDAAVHAPEPQRPATTSERTRIAELKLEHFAPTAWEKLSGHAARELAAIQHEIEQAHAEDDTASSHATHDYQAAQRDWRRAREFALRVLSEDSSAFAVVMREHDPFARMRAGHFQVAARLAQLEIPEVAVQIPASLASDLERLPDLAAAAGLRAGAELFALWPGQRAIVTVYTPAEAQPVPVLSAAFFRMRLMSLDLARLTPLAALSPFTHRMAPLTIGGLAPIIPLTPKNVAPHEYD